MSFAISKHLDFLKIFMLVARLVVENHKFSRWRDVLMFVALSSFFDHISVVEAQTSWGTEDDPGGPPVPLPEVGTTV